jgi:hypothetical protein
MPGKLGWDSSTSCISAAPKAKNAVHAVVVWHLVRKDRLALHRYTGRWADERDGL